MDYEALYGALTEARMHLIEDENEMTEAMFVLGELSEQDDDGVTMDGPDNDDDGAAETFEGYMEAILARLADEGMTADEAIELVSGVADELATDGELPSLPEDEEDSESISAWLGAAQSIGFEARVYATLEAVEN